MSQAQGWQSAGQGGSDQGTVRRANLALVLRSLRDSGSRSRARLAVDLGLNKATVSSLVGELIERGLVREGSAERGAVGRPGTIVEINGTGAFGVGAEINVHHVTTLAIDLAGQTISERRTSIDTAGLHPDQVVDRLVELLEGNLDDLAELGALPCPSSSVSRDSSTTTSGTVSVAPNLGWQGVPLARLLREGASATPPTSSRWPTRPTSRPSPRPPQVIRTAATSWSSTARSASAAASSPTAAPSRVVSASPASSGTWSSTAEGRRCGCGRTGCWETVIGFSRLIEMVADEGDLLRAPDLDLEARVAEINRRAAAGDERTLGALHEVGRWVGIGAAGLTNALNPGTIVLSGYLGEIGEWILGDVEAEVTRGVLAPDAGGTRICAVRPRVLGGCARGRCSGHRARLRRPDPRAPRDPFPGGDVMTETPARPSSPHAGSDAQPLLAMRGIVKRFPGVLALGGVELDVRAGEVHCLLGQNGAGKSTLIKVLSASYQPDEGEIQWEGRPVTLSTPQAAMDLGISTIYQELDLVPDLSVAENIFLGHEFATAGFSQRGETTRRARQLLARLGHPEIPAGRSVGRLSPAAQQIVSMARALSQDTRLLVLDEPSAVLDQGEVDNLFRVIRDLTAEGVAIVYISHRLEEIRQIGDRITVLKDGSTVATGLAVADTPTSELIKLMTGRSIEYVFPPRGEAVPRSAEPVLEVIGLELPGVFSGVDLSVRAGEIVGLAGLVGAGRSEILETLYGARRPSAGTVRVNGNELRRGSVPAAVKAGVGLCPEERKSQGLLLDQAVYRNITISTLGRFARLGFLDRRRGAPTRRRGHGVPRRTSCRGRPTRAAPVGRQPAEGRAVALAAPGVPGAAAGRADAGRRRRCPLRDLRRGPLAGRLRRRGRRRVERGRRGARAR